MRICVGQFIGAHGVRGLVKLASFTEDPAAIGDYGPLSDENGKRQFAVEILSAANGHYLARVDGISDRDAAQALGGTRLFVDRARLPPPDEDEFYHADLIGLRAELADGVLLGKVIALHDFGAGDVVEIQSEAGSRALYPFSRAVVPVVDLAGGRIVVEPPVELIANGELVADGAS
jgi:16S rRNA processing protein RimM